MRFAERSLNAASGWPLASSTSPKLEPTQGSVSFVARYSQIELAPIAMQ